MLKSFGVSGTGSTSPLNLDFVRLASSRLGSLRSVLAHPRSPLSLQLRIIGVNSGLNVNSGLKTRSSSLPLLFSLHQHKTNQSLPQPGGSQAQLTLDIRSEVCCNSTACVRINLFLVLWVIRSPDAALRCIVYPWPPNQESSWICGVSRSIGAGPDHVVKPSESWNFVCPDL